MHFCMDEMALRSQIFVDKSGLIEKTNCISGMTIKRCRSVKNKITYLHYKRGRKQLTESSFFCYHKCGKRDRDTMCGENGRLRGERGVFDGKNISDRELFLPAAAFRRSWFFRRIWKSLRWKRSRQTTPIPLPLLIHLPEVEGELLVNRVDLQVFHNKRRIGEPPDRCERRSASLCTVS